VDTGGGMEMAPTATPRLIHIIASSGFYGAERVVANLTGALQQWETTVFCMCNNPAGLATFDSSVRTTGQNFVSAPFSLIKALALLRKSARDKDCIVHAHDYKAVVLGALLLLSQRHAPRRLRLLVTQHGFTGRSLKGRFYNLIDKVICRWGPVERVVCVSSGIEQTYRDFGVPASRLVTIPNGVPPEPPLDKTAARQILANQWQLDSTRSWLGFAGRLSEEKNPILFLDIVQALHRRGSPVVALVAGDGPQLAMLRQHPLFTEHPESVRAVGFITDMCSFLASLDCLVVPSLTEGTPMVVLESMTQAVPVVCAAVGGLPDMITDSDNGLLVVGHKTEDYARLLESWLAKPQALTSLGQRARQHVDQQFSISRQAQAYAELYGDPVPS